MAIDIEKAFDTVSRHKLIETMEINNLAGEDELRIIQYLMRNTTLRAKIMKEVGDEFATKTGIPQGDAISPILFAIYLESIMRHPREKYPATGVQEDFILQYTDDTKILLHTRDLIPEQGLHTIACRCSICETERLNTENYQTASNMGRCD